MSQMRRREAQSLPPTTLPWLRIRDHFVATVGERSGQGERLGPLLVLADATFAPRSRFPLHPHRDMEIVTVVVDGEVSHHGNQAHDNVVPARGVQVISARDGMVHAEGNDTDAPTRMLQIWFEPTVRGGEAAYCERPSPARPPQREVVELELLFDDAPGAPPQRAEAPPSPTAPDSVPGPTGTVRGAGPHLDAGPRGRRARRRPPRAGGNVARSSAGGGSVRGGAAGDPRSGGAGGRAAAGGWGLEGGGAPPAGPRPATEVRPGTRRSACGAPRGGRPLGGAADRGAPRGVLPRPARRGARALAGGPRPHGAAPTPRGAVHRPDGGARGRAHEPDPGPRRGGARVSVAGPAVRSDREPLRGGLPRARSAGRPRHRGLLPFSVRERGRRLGAADLRHHRHGHHPGRPDRGAARRGGGRGADRREQRGPPLRSPGPRTDPRGAGAQAATGRGAAHALGLRQLPPRHPARPPRVHGPGGRRPHGSRRPRGPRLRTGDRRGSATPVRSSGSGALRRSARPRGCGSSGRPDAWSPREGRGPTPRRAGRPPSRTW